MNKITNEYWQNQLDAINGDISNTEIILSGLKDIRDTIISNMISSGPDKKEQLTERFDVPSRSNGDTHRVEYSDHEWSCTCLGAKNYKTCWAIKGLRNLTSVRRHAGSASFLASNKFGFYDDKSAWRTYTIV